MKVFFAASSAQLQEMKQDYIDIYRAISHLGHEVFQLYDYTKLTLQEVMTLNIMEAGKMHRKWLEYLKVIDVAVVESSMPGTINLGAAITGLVENGKPVLCMYKKGRKPVLIEQFYGTKLVFVEYDSDNIGETVRWGLKELEHLLNRRFTMLLSGELDAYLEKIMKQKGISRSEYIRLLLERDMGKGSKTEP